MPLIFIHLFQVDIKPYEDIKSFLRDGQHKKVWLSNQASHGLAACIPVAQPPENSNTGNVLLRLKDVEVRWK